MLLRRESGESGGEANDEDAGPRDEPPNAGVPPQFSPPTTPCGGDLDAKSVAGFCKQAMAWGEFYFPKEALQRLRIADLKAKIFEIANQVPQPLSKFVPQNRLLGALEIIVLYVFAPWLLIPLILVAGIKHKEWTDRVSPKTIGLIPVGILCWPLLSLLWWLLAPLLCLPLGLVLIAPSKDNFDD